MALPNKIYSLTFPASEKVDKALHGRKKGYTFALASQERRCLKERIKKGAK
jgi:hypothetical protein